MAENTGIRWDPNLQHARRATLSVGGMDHTQPTGAYLLGDSARNDSEDLLTQRNTPTALSAQRSVEPIDDAICAELDSIAQQDSASPALAPLRSQQSLPASAPNSSQSLHALSEKDSDISGKALSRALSARTSHGQIRGRRTSHSKSASLSNTKRSAFDRPSYPDQSFAALQSQFHNARPNPPLRTRSSHPAQNLLYNDMSTWIGQARDRGSVSQGVKTADNTPMSSPGLFSSSGRLLSASSLGDIGPQLHHLQAPKETDFAEIEHDTFSGNKFINNYEVVQELGRGEHGKVKLGRNMETSAWVAIKIVPRYSVKRRLGRLGAPEDRTKREVAILKKARHPNVVSLLEVIDDPSKNKVYLILEYVEKGEIKWRKPGVREVLSINNARFDQDAAAPFFQSSQVNEMSFMSHRLTAAMSKLIEPGPWHFNPFRIGVWSMAVTKSKMRISFSTSHAPLHSTSTAPAVSVAQILTMPSLTRPWLAACMVHTIPTITASVNSV